MSSSISVTLEQVSGYEFRIKFDESAIPELTTDLSAPLGHDAGPNPERMLAAAVLNCLSASLLFALSKFKNVPGGKLRATATSETARNAEKRMRVANISVKLELPGLAADYESLDRVLSQFESFCTVTESVRAGVEVDIAVMDSSGATLHTSRAGGAAH
jgi:organic hydroperoxide reductase OsmC/OhrA